MKYLYALFILLLALFLAAFIQQNGQPVSLKYFAWSTTALPLSLFIILSFAGGYVLAVLVGFSSGIRSRVRTAGAKREVKKLKSELDEVRGKQETPSGSVSAEPAPSAFMETTTEQISSTPKPSAVGTVIKGVSADELRQALEEEDADAGEFSAEEEEAEEEVEGS